MKPNAPHTAVAPQPSSSDSRTGQTPDPLVAAARDGPPHIDRHGNRSPALPRAPLQQLHLLALHPQLPLREAGLAQLGARSVGVGIELAGRGAAGERVALAWRRGGGRGGGDEGFEVAAFADQGLDACGEEVCAREEVRPVVWAPEWIRRKRFSECGEDVREWGEGEARRRWRGRRGG